MDSKTVAVNGLKGACKIFLQDIEALPEEAFCKSFGPKTRTVADIVYEVNLVNDHVGMVIRGEEPFVWPEGAWITAPEGARTKDVVVDSFRKSSEKILATAEGLSEEEFEAPLTTEDGVTNRFERCRFMTLHMWYHSGQLNFIQTLLGDDGWNWK
jgi:hypothetical protein